MAKKNHGIKNIVFSHIVLFILFISALPVEETIGLEKIVSTYILLLLITYALTENWKNSFFIAFGVMMLFNLIDSRGPFSDYVYLYNNYKNSDSLYSYLVNLGHDTEGRLIHQYNESFDVEPAGESEEGINAYSSGSSTEDYDNTNINEEDLDKLLEEDEKQSKDENAHLEKAGGGLDQLKDLLDMAKKDSPYSKKGTDDLTPAQAQRATYQLIDTVKQLKDTMTEMTPLLKVGKNLMGLHKQMGGKDFIDAMNNDAPNN